MSENKISPVRSHSALINAEFNQDFANSNSKVDRMNKWQCEVCTMVNQMKAKRCKMCSAQHPISISRQESIDPSSFLLKGEISSQQPINAAIMPENLLCGSNVHVTGESIASSSTDVQASGVSSSSNYTDNNQPKAADNRWICPNCTYNNSTKDKLCEICGFKMFAIRAASKPKSTTAAPAIKNGHDSQHHAQQRIQHDHSNYITSHRDDNSSSSSQDQRFSTARMEVGEQDEEDTESIQFCDNNDRTNELNQDISDSSTSYDSNSEDGHDNNDATQHNNNNEEKDGEEDDDEDDIALSAEDHQQLPQSDTWKCPQCTFINAVGFKFCDLCGCRSPVKGKLFRDKAVRTQLRLQKSDHKKAIAANKAAKKAQREANQKSKSSVIKKEMVTMDEVDDSSTVMINDAESPVSQPKDNNKDGPTSSSASGVKRRRVSVDSDYVSLSRKRQRKKSYLRRVAHEDVASVYNGSEQQLARSEKQSSTKTTMTISKEERAQELKYIYKQQFDVPPAMKRGMAIIWHCSECGMVNRLRDETCAKCHHIQIAPYRYCALCTYFKAMEYRKAKRLAAEEGGEHPAWTTEGRSTAAASSSSRRGILTAEFRRARDAAAEAAIPQFNRQPKVGPEFQLDPRALTQPCRFIRTALDYSLYQDRLSQHDVDEISPWEYTNDLYEVLWMPPRDGCRDANDFDAFLPKCYTSNEAATDEEKDENQVAEVVMDVVDAAVNLAVNGDIAVLFRRHPVLSMQCLMQCNYNLALATEVLPATIAKYGNNGLDPHVISMNEEQLDVFEEAMIVHGNENWIDVKNELKQQFSVAELQDFYLIVWSEKHKERNLEAERQHRIYNRMSATNRQRRLKNKQRSDSDVNQDDEQGVKGSDDGSEEAVPVYSSHQGHDEDGDQQDVVHIDGSMVSYYQVLSTAEQLSVVTCCNPPVHTYDERDEEMMVQDDSHVEMKGSHNCEEYAQSSSSSNEDDNNEYSSGMDSEIVMVVTSSSHLGPTLSGSSSELSSTEAGRHMSNEAVAMDNSS